MMQKWLDRIPELVLHGLLISLPLIFTTKNDELFEFPKMLVVYSAVILLLFSWARQSLMERKIILSRTPFDIPIWIFVASQIISTLFSINPHTSWYGYYSRFNGGLLSVFSYVVIYYSFIRILHRENIAIFLRSLLLGGVLSALYAFPEHFGRSPSCYLITGNFDVDCWVQDVQSRVFGTLGQPNWLAAYLVVLLPLTVSQMLWTKHTQPEERERMKNKGVSIKDFSFTLWPVAFALFTSVLLFTKSRSGILGAGIGLGIFTVGLTIHRLKSVGNSPLSILHFPSLLPLTLFLLLLVSIANPVRDKVVSILHLQPTNYTLQTPPTSAGTQLDNGGSESGDIRKVVWTGALKVWLRYPIFGSGVETFAYSYYRDRPTEHNLLSEWDFLYNKAHNEFLNYLATTGAVGLTAYLLMYGSFVISPIVWSLKGKTQPSLATIYYLLATASSLAGLSVSNFFGFSTVVVSLLTFALPAFAVVLAEKKKVTYLAFPSQIRHPVLIQVAHGMVGLTTCYLLLTTYSLYSTDVTFAQGKQFMSDGHAQDGVELIQSAVSSLPNEPVYRDELAYTAARLSYLMSTSGESTKAAQLAQASIDHSDLVMAQNSVNVNFYKTRVRIFTLLAQISPVFYDEAVLSLKKARELSPTDPKLTYNLALIAKERGDISEYEKQLVETVTLRPIDVQAQLDLGLLYQVQGKMNEARQKYEQVLKLDPKNEIAHIQIASLSGTIRK